MKTGVYGFQSKRLTQARESLGLTKAALSTMTGVSPATITNWEKGTQLPTEDKLELLASSIKFKAQWFLKEPNIITGEQAYFFRSLASTTKSAREIAHARLNWLHEIKVLTEQWVDFPKVNIPSLTEQQFLSITDEEIEAISVEARKVLNLGMGPISNLSITLESAGVILAMGELGSIKMDGVSKWDQTTSRPYVFISTDKSNAIRNRFDLAHELGHLVLHKNVTDANHKKFYKEIENQANFFAGCFLMPSESFSLEIKWPTLDNFLSLKKRWKVSVAAMIMRSYQLGLIDEEQKLRLFKGKSARGWNKGEPYDKEFPLESPQLLNRTIQLLVSESILSKEALADLIGLSKIIIEDLCGLEQGFLSEKPITNVIKLKDFFKQKSDSRA